MYQALTASPEERRAADGTGCGRSSRPARPYDWIDDQLADIEKKRSGARVS